MPFRQYLIAAFSLVELSIVLVILGLLVGGILTGQSLIRASELRSITTQYNNYLTAVSSFRDKYQALPGDMSNAQSFWGVRHATPAICAETASTNALTCNGDGDKMIEAPDASAGSNELYRFWQHLANAGLIEGQYSGSSQPGFYNVSTKANSPSGKISNTLWFVYYWPVFMFQTYAFNGTYGNTFQFGIQTGMDMPITPFLRPEEVWNLDTKMDDGKPATGKLRVMAYPTGLSACTTTVADNPATVTADYLLTATGLNCEVYFPQAF